MNPIDRVGLIAGTTSNSPLGMLIKSRTCGPLRMFSRDVTSHIVCTARWRDRYMDILDNNDMRYGCVNQRPDVRDGELVLVEATFPRCRILPVSHYSMTRKAGPHYVFIADPSPNGVDEEKINQLLFGFVGRRYELSVFAQMYGAPNLDPKDKREYCSEVGAHMLASEGAHYPLGWLRGGVKPFDIQVHADSYWQSRYRCYDPKELYGV